MNTRELKDTIKTMIASDEIGRAIEVLTTYLSGKDEKLHTQLILIGAQYSRLKHDSRIGVIDTEEGNILAKIRFNLVSILNDIPNDISAGGGQNTIYLSNRPYIDMENVIGRDSDIELLANTINKANKTVILNGWGGIGKTTVAKGYVNKYESIYKYVVWVEVVDELMIDFLNQVNSEKIGFISNENLTPAQNFKILIEKLDGLEHEKLIVIDNVNRLEDITESFKFFPQYCKVLITSRVKIPHFIEHKLGTLSEENAKTLFYRFYKKNIDDPSLTRLLELVGYHTLTIELIAKTAEEAINLDVKKMLQVFSQKKITADEFKKVNISLLKDKDILESQMYFYILSLFDISELSTIEKWILAQFAVLPTLEISGADLLELLQISDNEVKNIQILEDIGMDSNTFSNTINKLVQKGWIEKNSIFFQIHPLLQEVIREKVKPSYHQCFQLVNSLTQKLKSVENYFSNPKVLFEEPLNRQIAFSREISHYFADQLNMALFELANSLAFLLKEMYQLTDALYFQLNNITFISNHNSTETRDILGDCYDSLAFIHRELGQYHLAKEAQLNAINIWITEETNPLKAAIAYREMAIICKLTGDLQEGLRHVYTGFELIESITPEVYLEKARSYNDATAIFTDLGMWEESLKHLTIAKTIWEKYMPESRELSDAYNNFASAYRGVGNLESALAFQKKSVTLMEATSSEDHPVLAHKYSKLSIILQEMGLTKEALEGQLRALKIRSRIFGEKHPYFAHSCNFLSIIYFDLQDFDNALLFVNKAIKIREDHQSLTSTEIAESYFNLASILDAMNNLVEAQSAVEKSIKIHRFNNHPDLEKALKLEQKITLHISQGTSLNI